MITVGKLSIVVENMEAGNAPSIHRQVLRCKKDVRIKVSNAGESTRALVYVDGCLVAVEEITPRKGIDREWTLSSDRGLIRVETFDPQLGHRCLALEQAYQVTQ